MKTTKLVMILLALGAMAAPGSARTAKVYRGPVAELPRALAAPMEDGLLGTARFEGRARPVEGWTRWEFWWEANRDEFLRRAAAPDRQTGPEARFLVEADPGRLVTEGIVREKIIPVLMGHLGDPDPAMRARAAIALGKARETAAFAPLKALLDRGAPSDRAAASIALGLLGDPLAASSLIEQVRRSGLPHRDRAFAALGLGLLRSEEGAATLRELLAATAGYSGSDIEELKAASATALGLMGDRLALPILLRMARNHNGRADTVRAAAVLALGRIRARSALPVLKSALDDHDVDVRRTAAQALGILGDARSVPHLVKALDSDGDVQVRNFSAIALARIGGEASRKALVGALDASSPKALRGFAALALGILGDREGAPALRTLLERPDEPGLVAAACVGLGLLGDVPALPRIRSIALDESREDGLRGYALLSLALLEDPTARPLVAAAARDRSSVHRRRAAMTALSLDTERKTGRLVLAGLLEEEDPYVRGAAISSLAYVPRLDLVDVLVTVASERGFTADAAMDAVSALGTLAQCGIPSELDRFLCGVNCRSLDRVGSYLPGLL